MFRLAEPKETATGQSVPDDNVTAVMTLLPCERSQDSRHLSVAGICKRARMQR